MAAQFTILDALADWVGSQRWFLGGGMHPQLALVSSVSLYDDPDTRVLILIVSDDGSAEPVRYQMPIVLRRQRRDDSDRGFIGEVADGTDGTERAEGTDAAVTPWFVYDGPEDAAFTSRLLDLLINGGDFRSEDARVFATQGSSPASDSLTSRVLRGEQSNTSIIFSSDDGSPPIICKVFRMLHHGENPDIVLQSALFAAGSASVPAIVGSVSGEWPDTSQPTGQAHGHLAFAQYFLEGATDGWQRALKAASDGTDFSADARRMGVATADVHTTLATVMPSRRANNEDVAQTVIAWERRLNAAISEVPELESVRTLIESLYSRAGAALWPRLQRVHGDLHLGQVLGDPQGEWTIIDFEGEPMRPLEERSHPDLPLRDVAGMLRSFDYVAGTHTESEGIVEWAQSCRQAFIDGYSERSGTDVRLNPDLLDALEMDKALYEVVYEARNRPAWLPIPVAAVRRLARSAEDGASSAR